MLGTALGLVRSPLFKWVAGLVLAVGLGVAVYQLGKSAAREENALQDVQDFSDTLEIGRDAINDARQANPTRDPSIARERLRQRQLNR